MATHEAGIWSPASISGLDLRQGAYIWVHHWLALSIVGLSFPTCLERKLAYLTSRPLPALIPTNQSQMAQADSIPVLSLPATNAGTASQGHKLVCSLPILFLRLVSLFSPVLTNQSLEFHKMTQEYCFQTAVDNPGPGGGSWEGSGMPVELGHQRGLSTKVIPKQNLGWKRDTVVVVRVPNFRERTSREARGRLGAT